jgi:transposase
MDSKQKQHAVIVFLTKEGCRLSNIHRRLPNVYGHDTIDRSNLHRWIKKFKEREISIEDKPRRGRPSTATTDTSRQRVGELSHAERRVTLRELATRLECGHNAVKKCVQQCTPEFFQIGFKSWVQRWRKCIACDGDYVE